MDERASGSKRPSPTALVAAGLVVGGVLLWMFGFKSLLWVAGLGAFGPGIARELGWLRDQDEFQRQAAHRAGYHAYLIGGLVTVLVASGLQSPELAAEDPAEWVSLLLLIFWSTWLFSSLMSFWGARKTASRVLATFGSFWAVFVLASLVGDAAVPRSVGELVTALTGVLVGIGVVLPFFGLAWSAGRWPRRTGAALLVVAGVFTVVFFGSGRPNFQMATNLTTATLLLGPLVASGVALLLDRAEDAA